MDKYVKERVCKNELDDGHFGCSVCGCHVRNLPLGSTYVRDGKRWYSTEKRTFNYCPHCGAKVVSEGGERMSEYIVRMPPDMPYEIRAELNAWYVESEPIVRCRDCKHYDDYLGSCVRGNVHQVFAVEPDGFCKWGVRK